MKVFTLFAFLLVGCSLPVMRADSATCEVDADCTVVTPCCSCCAEVAMTVIDARTEVDRCPAIECRTDCSIVSCERQAPTRAVCAGGHCTLSVASPSLRE
jgi:hypothetical protein